MTMSYGMANDNSAKRNNLGKLAEVELHEKISNSLSKDKFVFYYFGGKNILRFNSVPFFDHSSEAIAEL